MGPVVALTVNAVELNRSMKVDVKMFGMTQPKMWSVSLPVWQRVAVDSAPRGRCISRADEAAYLMGSKQHPDYQCLRRRIGMDARLICS